MPREYESRRPIPPIEAGFPTFIAYETFEFPFILMVDATGTDYIVRRTPVFRLNGNYCLELQTKATTPTAGDYVWAGFHIALLPCPRVEISTTFIPVHTLPDWYVYLRFFYGFESKTNYWRPTVRVKMDTGEVAVEDDTGTFCVLDTLGAIATDSAFYLSFVADFRELKYVSVRAGAFSLDASAYKFYQLSGFYCDVQLAVGIENATVTRAHTFFDNLALKGFYA